MTPRRHASRPAIAGRLVTVLLVFAAAAAYGHGSEPHGEPQVRAVLDPLPPELAALQVQLRRTLAPQLLVANTTGKTLAIEDANGRAFLRIGSGHVEGDLGAAAFHRSNTLMAPGAIKAGASSKPRWQVVEDSPNWGWFDLRLRTDAVGVPHAVIDAGQPATVGHWSVPVHLGATDSAIHGHFEYVPPPQGIAEARVLDTGMLGDKALVHALAGSRRPGLFLSYRGDAPLTLLGVADEPFLRFAGGRVQVNRHSATWQAIAPAGAPGYRHAKADAAPQWAQVSAGNGYGWIEPRAAFAGRPKRADEAAVVKRWRIPIRIGETSDAIQGVTEWQPVTPLTEAH